MKKNLSRVLALILCAVMIFAMGSTALAADGDEAALAGSFDYYSTGYNYGEEVHSIVITTNVPLDPATVQASDFSVRIGNTNRTVRTAQVDGTKVTLSLQMRGSATNTAIAPSNVTCNLVGEVKTVGGAAYSSLSFTAGRQINPELDSMIQGTGTGIRYRLYVPKDENGDPVQKAPLYIWLHGAGEFGSDNRAQVTCSNLGDWLHPEVQDIFGGALYVMAIQGRNSPHNPANEMAAILNVCNEYNIDMNRIYIAGCSMGGRGTNDMIVAYPDFFAAAVPDCPASVITPAQAETLVDLPIIYLHAENDTTVRLSNSIQSWRNLVNAGNEEAYCNFFTMPPANPFTGSRLMGHFSWAWMHSNYTTTESEFISGARTFTYNNQRYDYVSTPLADIGDGYANIAEWMAAQTNAEVDPVLTGEYTIYSSCYNYGEEVHTVVLKTNRALDPETVEAADFSVNIGRSRNIDSIKVDGKEITFNLRMRGSATNTAINLANCRLTIRGEVADKKGNVFTEGTFTATEQINEQLDAFAEGSTENVLYRLFVPKENGQPAKDAPLYVWLHGAGEFGTNNRTQVTCANLPEWIEDDVQDIFGGSLYVMAIQSARSPHNPEYLMEAILQVCEQYDIDMNRIYIAGCSMGGRGTNDMIVAYPDFFAAAVPDCPASVITPEQAETLKDLPIIYLHAENDTTVRLSNSIQSWQNLKDAGNEDVYCNFFTIPPVNPFTGRRLMGHFSWAWIHSNYTTTEDEFISGENVYVRNGVEYPYVSTPLIDIDNGYANIAEWMAGQSKDEKIIAENCVVDTVNSKTAELRVYHPAGTKISSVRAYIESEVPFKEVISDNDIEYNEEQNYVIVYASDGGVIDDELFTLVYEFDSVLPDGRYPVNITLVEVTGEDGWPIENVVERDGYLVVDNNYPIGDISQDGEVDNRDLILLARYLVHLVEFNEKQLIAADFNVDGAINNSDLVLIARAIVNGN
jgi:predicted peptidase